MSTCTALSVFGVQLSHMSLWRNLQEQADLLEKQRHWKPVRVLGIMDYTHVEKADSKRC